MPRVEPAVCEPITVTEEGMLAAQRMIEKAFPAFDFSQGIFVYFCRERERYAQKEWQIKEQGTQKVLRVSPLLCFGYKAEVQVRGGDTYGPQPISFAKAYELASQLGLKGLVEIDDTTGNSIRWSGKDVQS